MLLLYWKSGPFSTAPFALVDLRSADDAKQQQQRCNNHDFFVLFEQSKWCYCQTLLGVHYVGNFGDLKIWNEQHTIIREVQFRLGTVWVESFFLIGLWLLIFLWSLIFFVLPLIWLLSMQIQQYAHTLNYQKTLAGGVDDDPLCISFSRTH